MATAVVIDSDGTTSSVIQTLLGPQHRIISYAKGSMADEFVRETAPDVVFLSMSLPDVSPIELLEQISLRTTGPPVVALMEAPRPPGITNAVRHGACEVLAQPLQAADLQASLLRALSDRRGLFPRTGEIPAPEIVGMSAGIVRLRQLIMRIAPSKAPVLIEGESGVGKELVAEAIHKLSQRAGGPFEARNCGAFPDTLFESEVFGTERGAFTGALRRAGAFELAHRGSIFLDELGELSQSSQVKLLRALETMRFHRVGGQSEVTADVRVITATNRNLRRRVEEGEFREDLYYRVNVVRLEVPALRNRREDIPLLVDHFHREHARSGAHGCAQSFAPDALDAMCEYHWPGNIRELRNVVIRSLLMTTGPKVRASDVLFA